MASCRHSSQLPPLRVVYAKAGALPTAAILRDSHTVIDHKLYWAAAGKEEACYLTAILNSETARGHVAHMQSRGQWDARDFDKLMFELPIPRFDVKEELHRTLAARALDAEALAATVPLDGAASHFVIARRRRRTALVNAGISGRIDALVAQLLGG